MTSGVVICDTPQPTPPSAIAKLAEGIVDGLAYQTLLGVTGSVNSSGACSALTYILNRTDQEKSNGKRPATKQ